MKMVSLWALIILRYFYSTTDYYWLGIDNLSSSVKYMCVHLPRTAVKSTR